MKNPSPLVSIVIISFNHSKFITDAMDSVILQNYPNIELFLYDNYSSDNSVEIIKSHPKIDEFKCVFNRENKGLISVLNDVLNKSKGEYFSILAGDDVMLFDKTLKQVEFLESNHIYYGCAGSQLKIDCNGNNLPQKQQNNLINSFKCIDKDYLFNHSNIIYSPTAMYRLKTLIELGGYCDAIQIEDLYMFYKAAYNNLKIALIPKVFVHYRIHGSNSHTKYDWMTDNKMKILSEYKDTADYKKLRDLIYMESFYVLSKTNKKRAKGMFFDMVKIYLNNITNKKSLYFYGGMFNLIFR
ncbi:glycosyltransferase family 2 protein [Photobacterium phosphoreum]|uniref:glycosyltransferase family 2 protein n=1 Tax=Photobacterium phosphoreum TaxID=659 RepID=UPI001E551819|nr:glycosyltransferase [Photobacterium phosphoreum]MCD9475608.1 glycosyltransferase [Photobacterium phosphoreum]MCF2177610.1 glycosyltransferase [Photobacterium phosphoreum]